jgi:hypothetical protein
MADIVDYELDIGEEFYFIVEKCIKRGICRYIEIKIYKDDEGLVQSTIQYLLETDEEGTFLVLSDNVYDSFALAAGELESMI